MRRRLQKQRQIHYCLLVNRRASAYTDGPVKALAEQIRQSDGSCVVVEPETPMAMAEAALKICGEQAGGRRPDATGLIACGGDGTFNLVARGALAANIPIGVLPMGRYNNIARALYGSTDMQVCTKAILSRNYQQIDCAQAAGLPFFGAIGLGFIPELSRILEARKPPRFGFGWGQLAGEAAEAVEPKRLEGKVDSFRFDITPRLFNVNLLPFAVGLPLSSASLSTDQQMEVIFDTTDSPKELAGYVKQIRKNQYLYGSGIRLFRGNSISLQPTQGQTLYLDGELLQLPTNVVDVQFVEKKLKVFC